MPVAARFHELRDRVMASVDLKFAEPIRLSPMKDGVTDPLRPQVQFEAVLRTGPPKGGGMDGGSNKTWLARISAGKGELHIDRTTYLGPLPRKGDALRAVSRIGEPAFEVLFVNDRHHTRLILELGEK